jgi:glyoxylate reductase
MKPEAFLINTSRGGTVDPDALRKALLEGRIAGAALDVTSPEPISKDDPLVFMENVLITPHIASASAATLRRMGLMAADNVIARLRGEKMPACLNPEAI